MNYSLDTLQNQFGAALSEMYDYNLTYIDRSRDRYILNLKNGIIHNRGLLFEREVFPNEQPYDPLYDIHVRDRARDLPIVYKRNIRKVKGRTLFVYHKFQWNIYHTFLHDCNTYLNCIICNEEGIEYDNVFRFADNSMNQFIYDKYLQSANIITDESFWFEDLTIINSGIVTYTDDLSVLSKQVRMLRDEFLTEQPTRGRIKLLTYRTRGGRRIKNIDEIKAYFSARDFIIMSDSELCSLNLHDQASLYNSASHIFSIFDSSLYNLVFCQSGTKVVAAEPTCKHLEGNEDAFEKVSEILGIEYSPVLLSHPYQCSRNWRDLDYNIDVSVLDEYFR